MDASVSTTDKADAMRRVHDLSGRVAVVTGGASGLGKAMAWGLAAHGANVALIDRDLAGATACAAEIAHGTGRDAAGFQADVSVEADVERSVSAVLERFGRVDVLVNNAGHNVRKPLIDFEASELDSLLAVHVRGAFLYCRAVGRHMAARRSGSIVNIASMVSIVGAPGLSAYAAAKAGLAQLGRVLALELAGQGVRVNSIAPGYIDTPLTRQHPEEHRARIATAVPLGRFGAAEDLVGPVVFLASDASAYVTGSTLVVDGGWTAQ